MTAPQSVPSPDGPPGALGGYRVVELGGPFGEWCGRLLATMGAEVIKVEPPGGAATRAVGPFLNDEPHLDRSLYFWHNNVNKRSVTLDLNRPGGVALLKRLIAAADIFLETLPPGESSRLGLDYGALAADQPRLVGCSITPFGPNGPYAQLHTTDLISMALGGPMQSCGYDRQEPELPPVRPGPNHSYHTAGHFAVTGILAALYEREESGRGQQIEVAAHDCLAVTVEFANTQWYYKQAVLRRQTGRHAGVQPTARTQYPTADGRSINLGLPRGEAAWRALLEMLRERGIEADLDEQFLTDPAVRFAQASRAYGLLEILCATHSAEDLFHIGQALGATWGAVRRPEEWLDDPHAADRDFFVQVEHPELDRTITYPGAPFVASASPWRIRRRAPLLGEDNAAVFAELGLSADEQAALRSGDVI